MATAMNVSPNRMELIKLKQRVTLAQKGHDLLKDKMDALVMELFDSLRKIQDSRIAAIGQLKKGYVALSECIAVMGTLETMQAARETRKEIQIDVSARNIMGIQVPSIDIGEVERNALSRGYGLYTTSSSLDVAAKEFEKALKLLVDLAELEATALAIAKELERTKRRVNALEYILIPRLNEALKFILMRLDEMERENFTRLKRIKAILEERE